jgi:hypothetical protein
MTTNKVYLENHFYGADNLFEGGTITVEQDAFIEATADNGLEVFDGPWKIKIDGYVESDLNGMAFYDPTGLIKNSSLTVGAEGTIVGTGTGFSGIATALALDVVNSGLIQGEQTGILYKGIFHSLSKTISITNNAGAEIRGSDYGIFLNDGYHDLILKNAGAIDAVWWGRGSTITNSGTIEELYEYSSVEAYNNKITNTGTISGSIGGGHGNDVVTNSGEIGTSVSLNNGNNTITNSGSIGTDIYTNEGNDTVTNKGSIGGDLHLGDGTNKLTNSGTIGGLLELGAGNDTIVNSGTIGGDVSMAGGINQLTNSGTIDGSVLWGIAANKLINSGTITGSILGDVLDDTYSNTKFIGGAVQLGDGKNTFTNGGTVEGQVTGGSGNDTLTNSKLIDNLVNLGAGNNKVTNSGAINGDLTTGTGNDVIKSTGSVEGYINSGSGDDQVTCGNDSDLIIDGTGNDIYKLGGGNDYIRWAASGKDLIDGGAGTFDQIGAEGLSGNIWVNLGTKAVTIAGHALAGSSAVVTSTANSATVKGIEAFFSGSGNDILAGSGANETLLGGYGSNTLYGGGGADNLYGQGDSDTFVYLSTKDSGNTKATRDTIQGFTGAGMAGGDVIDLSAIDADSKAAGNQAFHLLGGDVSFHNIAGEIRWVHELGDTIVQGDVNGDGKADFAIAVVGTVNFVDGDFSL